MYYVYMLQSPNADDIYIGFTPDLRRRMREHRSEHRNWRLIYYEAYATEKDARLRELRVKHLGSGKAELKKRLTFSLTSVSQIGAGRSEMRQPTVYQKHSTLPSREDDV
jgi:putative endonuclease